MSTTTRLRLLGSIAVVSIATLLFLTSTASAASITIDDSTGTIIATGVGVTVTALSCDTVLGATFFSGFESGCWDLGQGQDGHSVGQEFFDEFDYTQPGG